MISSLIGTVIWPQSIQNIAKSAYASTLLLVMEDSGNNISLGSGFVIGDGLIATNYHVIEGVSGGIAKLIGSSKQYVVDGLVASDKSLDLAILRISTLAAKTLPLGDSSVIQVGDTVFAVGNPLGMEGTFSQGIISGIRHIDDEYLIQITAPISPGSSGGPILNDKGLVVGVAMATLEGGQNLNFAVPINSLKTLLKNPKPLTRFFYRVGDKGPAGGSIFYDKGEYTEGWRYLEASPERTAVLCIWYYGKYLDVKTDTSIGSGKANTAAIIAIQGNDGNYAARVCDNLIIGGFDDWFLPSTDELDLLYQNKLLLLLPRDSLIIWSSSQHDFSSAWFQYFVDGQRYYAFKNGDIEVWAIRSF